MTIHTFAFLQNLSMTEILLFVGILVLFFGAKRLPVLFHSIGKSVSEFKRGIANEPQAEPVLEPVKEEAKS